MKNLILIFSLIIFTDSTVKAQEFVHFGAKGGLNLTNLKSDNFSETKSRTGFHLGLIAEISVGKRFSLQPEVLYSTQGTEADLNMLGSGPRPTEYNLDYIQVPVLAKIFLTESLSIEVGPSFNFLVNEKIDGAEADFGSNFEFGGALGASYKFIGGFFGSARYLYGFTDAFDREDSDNTINNTGYQLGVGLMF
ncbi:PorT family protein [Antarcticibacterium arcticum]|uniref:PorT family protein n=1 Tax=Antarcticibacterium arcticum TaxID=2585771 RepID=A0A5B8YN25_9FLAO|nr:porin family protein [Antarcticibacterium arcticum]QED38023.1 PorT family protein [Antarcticibacterium arcticum]